MTILVSSPMVHHSELYLVKAVDIKCITSRFQERCEEQFSFSKSFSHQNLPPTSQGLKLHIIHAFPNAFTIIHTLDSQTNIETENLDPLSYGYTLDSENHLSSTTWKNLEVH